MKSFGFRKHPIVWVGVLVLALGLSTGLGACGVAGDKFDQAYNGFSATMRTYDQNGQQVDQVHGASFRVTRDKEFDGTNGDGTSKEDSQVLLISLGKSHISHVGSSMILAQDGLTDIAGQIPPNFRFNSAKPGTPWLNDLKYNFGRYWTGSAKTIMIRSQNGTPIAIYTGNKVQVLSTEVPKSTWFRITGTDGVARTLFVYRVDYTLADNNLLDK